MGLINRIQHGWNAFLNRDPTNYGGRGSTDSYRPDRYRLARGNEKTTITSIYNRMALDASSISIKHVKLDKNDRYIKEMDSNLNRCLTIEANADQTGRAFMQDVVMSMLDEGCVAIVPIETDINPEISSAYDILNMRSGKILQWKPEEVQVRVYNERTGLKEDIWVPKKTTAIIENPFYSIMNSPNSTMQRLIHKLSLLDSVDEQSSSGKLDLIIQLPYIIKSEARRKQAEDRRKEIEAQLAGSKYGIAYTDGTEKITQLNRAVENNLMGQIQYLTELLFSQLCITQSIMDGTANEETMLNYFNRVIEPLVAAIVDEMKRKFLTKTAMTQKQSIIYTRDPFKLVPISQISEIADKLTRNEILSSNDVRQIIGFAPAKDPKAEELRNKNINNVNEPKPEQEPNLIEDEDEDEEETEVS